MIALKFVHICDRQALKASILNPDSIRFSELTNVVCDVLTLSRQVDKYRTLLLIICIVQSK
jgi:hypothetical protein